MKISLSEKELQDVLFSILCDGLYYLANYGFTLDYSEDEYQATRAKLTDPCIEDVQLQMLKDGYGLTFTDVEGEGEHTVTLTLAHAKTNVGKVPPEVLLDMVKGDYDAGIADTCLQYFLYGEVLFG